MSAHISGFSPAHSARRDGPTFSFLRNALTALREWPQRRAVLAELSSLTDRELADVGLTRGDLPHVFDAGFAYSRAAGRLA